MKLQYNIRKRIQLLLTCLLFMFSISVYTYTNLYASGTGCKVCGGQAGDQECFTVNIAGFEACLEFQSGDCFHVGQSCDPQQEP